MKSTLVPILLVALAFGVHHTNKTPNRDEAAIIKADEAWAAAIAAKSVTRTLKFYTPDAVSAGSAMFQARGLSDFRAEWSKLFQEPGYALTWTTTRVIVTQSGSIAYSTGTWESGGQHGPFLAVWQKQPNAEWKIIIDSAWTTR